MARTNHVLLNPIYGRMGATGRNKSDTLVPKVIDISHNPYINGENYIFPLHVNIGIWYFRYQNLYL